MPLLGDHRMSINGEQLGEPSGGSVDHRCMSECLESLGGIDEWLSPDKAYRTQESA